jgi:hypothetical protein
MPRAAGHWGGDSIANNIFWAPDSTPAYACLLLVWGFAGGDRLIPQFYGTYMVQCRTKDKIVKANQRSSAMQGIHQKDDISQQGASSFDIPPWGASSTANRVNLRSQLGARIHQL